VTLDENEQATLEYQNLEVFDQPAEPLPLGVFAYPGEPEEGDQAEDQADQPATALPESRDSGAESPKLIVVTLELRRPADVHVALLQARDIPIKQPPIVADYPDVKGPALWDDPDDPKFPAKRRILSRLKRRQTITLPLGHWFAIGHLFVTFEKVWLGGDLGPSIRLRFQEPAPVPAEVDRYFMMKQDIYDERVDMTDEAVTNFDLGDTVYWRVSSGGRHFVFRGRVCEFLFPGKIASKATLKVDRIEWAPASVDARGVARVLGDWKVSTRQKVAHLEHTAVGTTLEHVPAAPRHVPAEPPRVEA
jgi:hypothetical protein